MINSSKKVGIILAFSAMVLLFLSFISSEIIFPESTKAIYNIGDSIDLPITVKASDEVSGILEVSLICSSQTINFYKNGVHVIIGEEKSLESSLVLVNSIIGDIKGECKIKATLNDEYATTNAFNISNSLTILRDFSSTEFNPGESISIKGKVTKDNLQELEGYIEADIVDLNDHKKVSQT